MVPEWQESQITVSLTPLGRGLTRLWYRSRSRMAPAALPLLAALAEQIQDWNGVIDALVPHAMEDTLNDDDWRRPRMRTTRGSSDLKAREGWEDRLFGHAYKGVPPHVRASRATV